MLLPYSHLILRTVPIKEIKKILPHKPVEGRNTEPQAGRLTASSSQERIFHKLFASFLSPTAAPGQGRLFFALFRPCAAGIKGGKSKGE
jgi:hypothetical protein